MLELIIKGSIMPSELLYLLNNLEYLCFLMINCECLKEIDENKIATQRKTKLKGKTFFLYVYDFVLKEIN